MYIPADFKEHAYDTHISLIIRYNASSSQIYKWKQEVHMLKPKGRPRLKINTKELNRLRQCGWSTRKLARHFKCDKWTIRNRLNESKKETKNAKETD
uniref:Transposase IS30-like HTH domain-containing protein n=1 Tax=Dulem virus 30 TaxID=3145748 RepID=A0AAU8B741_9CAUD